MLSARSAMMENADWLIISSLAGLAAVGVLRISWSRRGRSQAMNLVGWGLLFAGCLCGVVSAGAWGVAVAALSPMLGAFVLLAVTASCSEPAKPRKTRRSAVPQRAPARLAARSVTFLLTALIAALIALGIATAAGALALLAGTSKSDAYATSLFVMPLVWAMLAFVLLMQSNRRGQLKVLALASIPAWPCLAIGVLS